MFKEDQVYGLQQLHKKRRLTRVMKEGTHISKKGTGGHRRHNDDKSENNSSL